MPKANARSLDTWDGDISMGCTSFDISCDAHEAMTVSARFVVPVTGYDGADVISEATRRISHYLASGHIDFVKGGGGPRCFYCGVLGKPGEMKCEQCGGSY